MLLLCVHVKHVSLLARVEDSKQGMTKLDSYSPALSLLQQEDLYKPKQLPVQSSTTNTGMPASMTRQQADSLSFVNLIIIKIALIQLSSCVRCTSPW